MIKIIIILALINVLLLIYYGYLDIKHPEARDLYHQYRDKYKDTSTYVFIAALIILFFSYDTYKPLMLFLGIMINTILDLWISIRAIQETNKTKD